LVPFVALHMQGLVFASPQATFIDIFSNGYRGKETVSID
jgi:hypothetical protein